MMNGFEIFCRGTGGAGVDPARIVPAACKAAYEYSPIGQGENILTWGRSNGDIHFIARGKNSYLVLSGYLVGAKSRQAFNNQSDAAEWCLAQIDGKESFEALAEWLSELHGSFGFYYRNDQRDVTYCIADRMASRPLWRKWHNSGWLVSSHPTAIALSLPSPKLDAGFVASFLLYGGPVDPSKNLFQGVEGTPPGTIVSLDAQGNHNEYRWYSFHHQPDNDLSLTDWVNLTSERLLSAASRLVQSGENLAVFFSGGTDSRLAAAALKAAGGSPLLVTLGDGENLEVKVARKTAKALGLRHKVIWRDNLWYLRSLENAVYETGGNYVWIHGHFSEAAASVSEEYGATSFILGDLCEAFSKLCCSVDQAGKERWSPEEFVSAFDQLRLPLYRPANRESTLSLLNAKIRAEVETSIVSEITDYYGKVSDASKDPLILGDQCLRWNSVQTIPTFFMFMDLRSSVPERNMMFDANVHEVLEMLPSRFRNEKNLGALLIHKLHPRAAWVMNSNSMLPMCWPPAAHKLTRRIKPILGKARRFIFGNTYRTTGSWPKHSILYATDPEWRRSFESILNQADLFDPEIFDRDAIRQCWHEFLLGKADRVGDVEKLVQLGILSRMLKAGN
jgi:hypothetical protein